MKEHIQKIKNLFKGKYKKDEEAVIITCYFNPQKSEYRLKNFNIFYNSIKHLNHRIIECVIGEDQPELPKSEFIKVVNTKHLLWHKESLLNSIIKDLPEKFKYVFWLDADIMFQNNNWLVDSCNKMRNGLVVLQPFSYCVHLEKDEYEPCYDIKSFMRDSDRFDEIRPKTMWKSFGYNFETNKKNVNSKYYDRHGHVGFGYGMRIEELKNIMLYEKALVGSADHIMAHAFAGQIKHKCISACFQDSMEIINEYSIKLNEIVQGRFGYSEGVIYHLWHGSLKNRQYSQRNVDLIEQEKLTLTKDENGLFVLDENSSNNVNEYMNNYFKTKEQVN